MFGNGDINILLGVERRGIFFPFNHHTTLEMHEAEIELNEEITILLG